LPTPVIRRRRAISSLLAFALAASLLALTPAPAQAHDSCAIARPAATGVIGTLLNAVNVFATFLDTSAADCPDKFADVVGKPDRDFTTDATAASRTGSASAFQSSAAAADQAGDGGTFAPCVDGFAGVDADGDGMFPCDGVDLLSHVSPNELGTGALLNDIWGWTDPSTGEDYALVGTRDGTSFVNIADPLNPVVYGRMPTNSTQGGVNWRDVKVYEDHAYVVSENTNHGVQVFDLTRLREWAGEFETYEADTVYTGHGSAHNIFINEDTGFAYSVGAAPFFSQPLPNTVTVDAPSSAEGSYLANGAAFGPLAPPTPLQGTFEVVNSGDATPTFACTELVDFTEGAIAIAFRGGCPFVDKAINAQNAGASALIVVNNVPGTIRMGGSAPEGTEITIPSVMVSDTDGATIIAGLPATGGLVANDPPAECGDGLHITDLDDPANPVFAGCFQDHGYVHDTQCVIYDGPDTRFTGREICVNSNGIGFSIDPTVNFLSIADVTDKANPIALAQVPYDGSGYSHQGWLTEDQTYFLHGDEGDEVLRGLPSTTRVWDLSDLRNPFVTNTFTNGQTSIDHNLYTEGRYAYAANYTTGLRVFDLVDIDDGGAVSEVGFFDTYPENDNATFEGGPWSNFPYFAQPGIVAVSSIDRGLFVLQPQVFEAVDDEYRIRQNRTLVVDAPGVLANDFLPAGTEPSVELVTDVGSGQLTLAEDGSFTYVPRRGFRGVDTFTYRVGDETSSAEATVSITVDSRPAGVGGGPPADRPGNGRGPGRG
jgi:hypothetical protein